MPVLHNFVNPIADEPGFLGTKPSDWNDSHATDIVDADVNVAAGIVESKLALNFPTHAAVTIGTASGLSLVGQVLSLGLASSGVTGALSGTDWDTFNGKQSSLTFPLASTLGGTGVNNAGTLTNASNTTITGGGTVALGGFTLTVPATGTAALLATANVFTAAQTIDGSADAVQLRVQGNATQTSNIISAENSSAEGLFSLSNLGVSTFTYRDSGTNDRPSVLYIVRNTSGTPADGFGLEWKFRADTNGGNERDMMTVQNRWTASADASRKARITWFVNDSGGPREALRMEAFGTRATLAIGGVNANSDYAVTISNPADIQQLYIQSHTTQTNPMVYFLDNTAATNTVRNVLKLETQSTGTAAAGLGTGLLFSLETATAGTMQSAGRVYAVTVDATNASRKYALVGTAYDTAEREGWRVEASGTAAKLGLYGATPVIRATNVGAAGAFVANTSGIVNDTATFGGYTLGQIVQALQNIGILT